MPDEPTLGELARRIDAVNADLKEDLRAVDRRLDHKVEGEVFKLEQRAQDSIVQQLLQRVTAIEEDRRRESEQAEQERRERAAQRANDRRLVLTAIVVPLLIVLLQAYLTARGAGS